tara:strand:+ start:3736 stop:3906 length:171 start_codon:yes stop_codon:yes gene_type:complete
MTPLCETVQRLITETLSRDEILIIFNKIAYGLNSQETSREERRFIMKVLEDLGKLE